ncbi:uncharacterized protein UHOD_02537 [Ustilago sp. UG-2017b]|nr:uncharacterized protein UHOD_02537 [Ustilago sp. UG-2017b]
MPAATKRAGPSGSTSKEGKGKRVRKRTRNKKRTAEVEDSSDSSSSSSDDSDDEEQKTKAATTPKKPVVGEQKKAAKAESSDDSSSDSDSDSDSDDGEADGKRKRKRKRAQKKKPAKDNTAEASTTTAIAPTVTPAAAASAPAPTSSTAKPIDLKPEDIGPDPNTDLRLSDQAKQAIQYAQIYSQLKPQWKFNKAKQNWLLRNALSVPPSDYDTALARKQSENAASAGEDGAAEEAEEAEEGENFVPGDFVLVVTAYLNSVMGGARQRLIESLREAVNAPAIEIAPTQAEVTDDAGKSTATNGEEAKQSGEGAATKSFSFGNLALDTEKKEEAAEAAGLPAGTDPQAVELRRARATQMLQHMDESV